MRIGIGNDHYALELIMEQKLRKAVITLFMEKSLEERLFQKRLIVVF